jgi:hypothetical protein
MAKVDFHYSELTQRLTFRVRGLRGFGVRFWVARQLFRLGCRIARVGVVFEVDDGGDAEEVA